MKIIEPAIYYNDMNTAIRNENDEYIASTIAIDDDNLFYLTRVVLHHRKLSARRINDIILREMQKNPELYNTCRKVQIRIDEIAADPKLWPENYKNTDNEEYINNMNEHDFRRKKVNSEIVDMCKPVPKGFIAPDTKTAIYAIEWAAHFLKSIAAHGFYTDPDKRAFMYDLQSKYKQEEIPNDIKTNDVIAMPRTFRKTENIFDTLKKLQRLFILHEHERCHSNGDITLQQTAQRIYRDFFNNNWDVQEDSAMRYYNYGKTLLQLFSERPNALDFYLYL
uniref:Uncharacterized protein n=1 Tax=viral metagenome TaxID=1070528 RepID=A0A6C0F7J2_9ZZZZ|tara:strand:+ start:8288 stop:9124 length:837 start_codon:yes stop_codon:yes gene_type:complete